MKQGADFSLNKVQMLEQRTLMIQKILLNIETIWLIFTKALKVRIQIKNVKYQLFLMI